VIVTALHLRPSTVTVSQCANAQLQSIDGDFLEQPILDTVTSLKLVYHKIMQTK